MLKEGGGWGRHTAETPAPLPGAGPTLALLPRAAVLRQPLAADVLHHRVLSALCGPKDVLDQRAGPAGLQLHRLQVSRAQFAAEQVSFDLRAQVEAATGPDSLQPSQRNH